VQAAHQSVRAQIVDLAAMALVVQRVAQVKTAPVAARGKTAVGGASARCPMR
jgi:hypothetical protein